MLVSDDGRWFAFEKRELTLLTAVMAAEDREGLAALWLDGRRAAAWATDGNRAVMVEREIKPPKAPKNGGPVAIPAVTAHHATKTARKGDWIVIDLRGSRVTIDVRAPVSRAVEIESYGQLDALTRSKHLAACQRHDGALEFAMDDFFPAHHRRGSKGATVALNPAKLAAVRLLGLVAEGSFVWFSIGKADEPLLLVAEAAGDPFAKWRMLVMPLRAAVADHPDHDRPKVAKGPAKVRAAS